MNRVFPVVFPIFVALVVTTGAPLIASADRNKVAVLPLENLAGISEAQSKYLHDVIRGAAAEAVSSYNVELIPQDQVTANLRGEPTKLMECDEGCAALIGRSLGARLVLHTTINHIHRSAVVILKLLDAESGSLKKMERVKADNLTDLEEPLEEAVKALLDEEQLVALPPPPTTAGESPVYEDADSFSDSYYGELTVIAKGYKENDKNQTLRSVEAEVFINGSRVGTTPYRDGLPAGSYKVEVKFGASNLQRKTVIITAGKTHSIRMKFRIPLTAAERDALEEKRRAEKRARQEKLRAQWQTEHDAWKEEADPLRAKRNPMLVSGIILAVSGVTLVITGAALEDKARNENEQAEISYDNWKTSVDPEEQEFYADSIKKHQNLRDRSNVAGITCLSIGGAAAATSIILFVLMPSVPREPRPPSGLDLLSISSLKINPLFTPGFQGASLEFSF